MKRLLALIILLLGSLAMAQEEAPASFDYAVPLPATFGVSYTQWHYQLEFAFEDGEPGTVTLFQYDRRGVLYGVPQTIAIGKYGVHFWDSATDIENLRVRSILLRADRPLIGKVIGDQNGQLLANGLVANLASEVVVPFVPEITNPAYYDQLTLSLSVFGAAADDTVSDLDFILYDDLGVERTTQRVRDDLASNGVVPVTPYFSLLLGGLDAQATPAWARIAATDEKYHLTAIQAYELELDASSLLTAAAATESETHPVAQGQLIFTNQNRDDEGWVVLTNPHNAEITVDFRLFYTPDFNVEQQKFVDLLNHDEPIVFNERQTLVLKPLERRLIRLGEDLFAGIAGLRHRISYTSYQWLNITNESEVFDVEPVELLPRGIFALSFFTDGAYGFTSALFSEIGNTADFWIRLDTPQDKYIELATVGEQYWVPNVNSDADASVVAERLDPSAMFATSVPNGDLVSDTSAVTIEIFSGEKLINRSETVLKPGDRFTQLNTASIRQLFAQSGAVAYRIRVTGHDGAPLTASEVLVAELDAAALKPHIYQRDLSEASMTLGGFESEESPTSLRAFKN